MSKRFLGLLAVVLVWVVASMIVLCGDGTTAFSASRTTLAASPDSAPAIAAVTPSSAANDLETPIVITGTGFTAVPTITLGNVQLEEVTWVSGEKLTATVPWGLGPGVYTMTAENPGGEMGSLSGAFTVTQGIGVWTTGGPYGGRVQQILVNPATPTTAYAVVFLVGASASFDGAEHWEPMVTLNNPTRIAFDAQDPDVIYTGGSGMQGDSLRSMDGGETWQVFFDQFFPANGSYMSYPAPHPSAPGVVYVATGGDETIPILPGEGGIYYSDDYGESWVTRTVGLTDTHLVDLVFHPTDHNIMAAATCSGNVFTTTDGGLTWHWAANLQFPIRRLYFNPFGAHEAWIVPQVDYQPPAPAQLYKSTDPGLSTWVSTALPNSSPIWSLAFQADTIWAGVDQGYVSDDGGATWRSVMGPDGRISAIQTFAFPQGDDQTIYVGSELQGVGKSVDGGATWLERNEGLGGLQMRSLAVPRGAIDTIYANTYERGMLRSDNGGTSWLSLGISRGGSPKGPMLATDPTVPRRVYLGNNCDGFPCVQLSEDAGRDWQTVTMTLPYTEDGWMGEVLVVAPHPGVPGRILAGAGFFRDREDIREGIEPSGIYASDDYGESWSFLGPTPAISEVLNIAFDTGDPNVAFAGTRGMGLWKTTDGGDSWGAVSFPGVLPPVHIASIAPHPDIPSRVYVRLYSYADSPNPQPLLFVSDDAGVAWQELPDVHTVFGGIGGRGLVFAPPTPDSAPYALYSGCEVGLCVTWDDGTNWQQVDGAPRPSSHSLFDTALVAGADGERVRLYVGTPGATLSGLSATAPSSEVIPGLGHILGGGVYRLTTARSGQDWDHWADTFDSPKLDSRWTWVREDPSLWSLTENPGFMRITSSGSLRGPGGNQTNLLLTPAPEGDFRITASVTVTPTANYHGATLMVYEDDDNYLEVQRRYVDGRQEVLFRLEVDGVVTGTSLETEAFTLFLRVAKEGDDYRAFFSPDGSVWTFIGQHSDVGFSRLKLGVSARMGPEPTPVTADFDSFVLDYHRELIFLPLVVRNAGP